jgi:hypothetical protein
MSSPPERAECGVERRPRERAVGVEAQPRRGEALTDLLREGQLGVQVATQLELECVRPLVEARARVVQLERGDPRRHAEPRGHLGVALGELEAVPQHRPQGHGTEARVSIEERALEPEARRVGLAREALTVLENGAREGLERVGLHLERGAQRAQGGLRLLRRVG